MQYILISIHLSSYSHLSAKCPSVCKSTAFSRYTQINPDFCANFDAIINNHQSVIINQSSAICKSCKKLLTFLRLNFLWFSSCPWPFFFRIALKPETIWNSWNSPPLRGVRGLLERALAHLERALALLEQPLGLLERFSPMGVRGALERPSVALGTRFSANGTAPWASGTPLGSWNRASGSIWNARQRKWNCPKGSWNAPSGLLERFSPRGVRGLLEQSRRLPETRSCAITLILSPY